MKVKQEVKDLCMELIKASNEKNTDEFEKIKRRLESEYKFTPYSLLALFYKPPIIEYSFDNVHLIME